MFRITGELRAVFEIFYWSFALYLVIIPSLVDGLPELVDIGRYLLDVDAAALLRLLLLLLQARLNMIMQTHVLLEYLIIAFYLFLI